MSMSAMVVTLGLSFGAAFLGRDCPENTVQIAVSGNHQPGPVCMPLASQGDVMKHTPSTNDTVVSLVLSPPQGCVQS